jgi:hypothetical protein
MYANAETADKTSADRVRRSTAPHINERIDREIEQSIKHHRDCAPSVVRQRIQALDEEWDIERVLEVNASTLAFTGLVLGSTVNRKWLALPAAVLGFLFQHGVQGWCPPLPILRRMGVRTRGEIEREKYALKALMEKPTV